MFSGFTKKANELKESQGQIASLNSEIDVQKSRYEFHIAKLKKRVEEMTLLLEEKGVSPEELKVRMSTGEELHTDTAKTSGNDAEERASLYQKHEQEVNDLRHEIDMLMIDLEKERKVANELQKQFDAEFEHLRVQHRKDRDEMREEIEIYQQLLQEELAKSKNCGSNDAQLAMGNVKDVMAEQKRKYGEEIAGYLNEIETLKSSRNENDKFLGEEVNMIKEEYEFKIAELQSELDSRMSPEEMKVFEEEYEKKLREAQEKIKHSEEIENIKEYYEQIVSKMQTELQKLSKSTSENLDSLKIDYDSKIKQAGESVAHETTKVVREEVACQTDKIVKHVCFNMDSELDDQKKRIRELTEERNEYMALLEENVQNTNCGNVSEELLRKISEKDEELAEVKETYASKISQLEEQLLMVKANGEHMEAESHLATDLHTELLRGEIQELKTRHKAEVKEIKEKLRLELEHKLAAEKEKYENMVMSTNEANNEENLESLKKRYQDQIEELNEEIVIYRGLLEEKKGHNEAGNVRVASLEAEIESLKAKVASYEELLQDEKEKNAELSMKSLADNEDKGENIDLHTELLRGEIQELKTRHEAEVEEIKEKLRLEFEHKVEQMKEEFKTFAEQHFGNENVMKLRYEEEIETLKNELDTLKQELKEVKLSAEAKSMETEKSQESPVHQTHDIKAEDKVTLEAETQTSENDRENNTSEPNSEDDGDKAEKEALQLDVSHLEELNASRRVSLTNNQGEFVLTNHCFAHKI